MQRSLPACLPLLAMATSCASLVQEGDAVLSPDDVHPRMYANIGLNITEWDTEGVPFGPSGDEVIVAPSTRFEWYSPVDMGTFVMLDYAELETDVDDPNPDDSKYEATRFYAGVCYRMLIDANWRIPIRVGPFTYTLDTDQTGASNGPVDFQLMGLQLMIEPEYIVWQDRKKSGMTEWTIFAELGIGAGQSTIENDIVDDEGQGYIIDTAVGSRHRMRNGMTFGGEIRLREVSFGPSNPQPGGSALAGRDEDFFGLLLSFGWRG